MAVIIQASRSSLPGGLSWPRAKGPWGSMIKAYVCRAAEWDALRPKRIHSGMGYAEIPGEPVLPSTPGSSRSSRSHETLATQVIALRWRADLLSLGRFSTVSRRR